MVMHKIYSTWIYVSDSSPLPCAVNPLASQMAVCLCLECKKSSQPPKPDIKNFYQINPIQPMGYRLEWWGDDGTHFWDYRKFSTAEEAQVAALTANALYTFNGEIGRAVQQE